MFMPAYSKIDRVEFGIWGPGDGGTQDLLVLLFTSWCSPGQGDICGKHQTERGGG